MEPYAAKRRSFRELISDALALCDGSAIAVAEQNGMKRDAIRAVLRGQVPSVDRAAEICAALDLEFYIGPHRSAQEKVRLISTAPEIDGMTTVSDPRLADMIAGLADAWESADTFQRGHMQGRFDLAFKDERERAASEPGSRLARLASSPRQHGAVTRS